MLQKKALMQLLWMLSPAIFRKICVDSSCCKILQNIMTNIADLKVQCKKFHLASMQLYYYYYQFIFCYLLHDYYILNFKVNLF